MGETKYIWWKQRNGTSIRVKNMSTSHLENAINIINREPNVRQSWKEHLLKELKSRANPVYIGDGLYMKDNGHNIAISVNHHENEVAFIDETDIDKAIDYLTRVKNR